MRTLISFLTVFIFGYASCFAQEDLLEELDTVQTTSQPVTAAFKGLQIVTLQSTKLANKGALYFVVSHRFGTVKNGFSEFFGLDNATTKIGGVYGVTDWLSISAARHTLLKTYEGGAKYRLLAQTDKMPFTVVGYNVVGVNSLLDKDDYPKLEFSDRLWYVNELLVSRKFSSSLSLQLVGAYTHKNLYQPGFEKENQVTVAAGGRLKLTTRLSLNLEYAYNFDKPDYYNQPLSVGLDIETGGHVFQLLFTNSQAMTESGYLTNAIGDWGDGDFFFGFNLYRVF